MLRLSDFPHWLKLEETVTRDSTEHKGAARYGDADHDIDVHHQLTNRSINWNTAYCLTYSTNYYANNYRHLTRSNRRA